MDERGTSANTCCVKRHMQPSARPWTRMIRAELRPNLSFIRYRKSCWNIHELRVRVAPVKSTGHLLPPTLTSKLSLEMIHQFAGLQHPSAQTDGPKESSHSSLEALGQAQGLCPRWNNCRSVCKSWWRTGKNKSFPVMQISDQSFILPAWPSVGSKSRIRITTAMQILTSLERCSYFTSRLPNNQSPKKKKKKKLI